jgi:hypothetical protein
MTVVLNEAALAALLDTPEGRVGQLVASKAAIVVQKARVNVRDYFQSAPTLTVDQDIDFEMLGSSAIVGIRDAGSKARRIARAQAEGRFDWLLKALEV